MLDILQPLERSIYYPLCGFVSILTIWAYLKYASAERPPNEAQKEPVDLKRDPRLARILGLVEPTPSSILASGAELLAKGKAWRIGAALALLLAKQMEEEIAHGT
jgi:hypothetical protein